MWKMFGYPSAGSKGPASAVFGLITILNKDVYPDLMRISDHSKIFNLREDPNVDNDNGIWLNSMIRQKSMRRRSFLIQI